MDLGSNLRIVGLSNFLVGQLESDISRDLRHLDDEVSRVEVLLPAQLHNVQFGSEVTSNLNQRSLVQLEAVVKQQQSVELHEYLAAWLVDGRNHGLASSGFLLEQLHNVECTRTVEAASGLVQQYHHWVRDQFISNRCPFALAT